MSNSIGQMVNAYYAYEEETLPEKAKLETAKANKDSGLMQEASTNMKFYQDALGNLLGLLQNEYKTIMSSTQRFITQG